MTSHNESGRAPVTTQRLRQMKEDGEKIAVLTCYDAAFAQMQEACGVDVMLVGDSLGMVLQGQETTLSVSVDDMVYHAAAVARRSDTALRVVDMPFMSYPDIEQGLANAARLMREGGAQMVKLEGGSPVLDVVNAMTKRGVPVCGHLGLLPQSVNQLGGYRVQGRAQQDADRILREARALQDAGASLLVLECVPSDLAREITEELAIPTIGIGAGPDCDGQVLVLHDMLGITPGKPPRFCRNFMEGSDSVEAALRGYVSAVKDGSFPASEHGY